MEEYGIKEFDPKHAMMAPGVITPVQDLISELELPEKEAKELFVSINKKMRPVKDMPIPEDKAWDKLLEDINIRKADAKKLLE